MSDPKLTAAELAAGIAAAKKQIAQLPFFERAAITDEEITDFVADIVSAVDTVRDQAAQEGH